MDFRVWVTLDSIDDHQASLDLGRWLYDVSAKNGAFAIKASTNAIIVTAEDREILSATLTTWPGLNAPGVSVHLEGAGKLATIDSRDNNPLRAMMWAGAALLAVSYLDRRRAQTVGATRNGGPQHTPATRATGADLANMEQGGQEVGSDAETPVIDVSIYISDESHRDQVESAVETWLASAGMELFEHGDAETGSWFRAYRARLRLALSSRNAKDAAEALGAYGSAKLQEPGADVTEKLTRNLPAMIAAILPLEEAAIRVGDILMVKVGPGLAVVQLTPRQILMLTYRPELARMPREILGVLSADTPTQSVELPFKEVEALADSVTASGQHEDRGH